MINIEKEFAFLDLAAEVLKISKQERAFIRQWINRGHEFSSKLWEEMIQKLAKTKFTDVAHMDFADGTESKSACTRLDANKGGIVGQITNVDGKTGWIRVACYNNWKKTIDFFLLPPNHTVKAYFSAATGNRGHIKFSYNRSADTYSNNLELYRVKLVKDVCKQKRYLKIKG